MLKLTNHKENASNESLEIKLAILILAGDWYDSYGRVKESQQGTQIQSKKMECLLKYWMELSIDWTAVSAKTTDDDTRYLLPREIYQSMMQPLVRENP